LVAAFRSLKSNKGPGRLETRGRILGEWEYLMQFFAYNHLPEKLQAVSKPFGELAEKIMETCPASPERHEAFRKLLEAKDCAVRSTIFKVDQNGNT
jgi:hypothetical protein